MAQFYDDITPMLQKFIEKQPMFFTASACSSGRVNLSPKGMGGFRILNPKLCGYMDMVGSGNETAAHIKNDGRLTFMFNSYGRQALIVRLYGQGRVVRTGHPEFDTLAPLFPERRGQRQIILMDVESTQTSCGWGVPEMELIRERNAYQKFLDKTSDEKIVSDMQIENVCSIDGFDTGLND
ncbi:pyridoxamine 5'-phosphate oxidase family protein [Kordiimonas pumila]|uniref:Pyridoxamine 5'-phosphate oxidase family protein n=1 Tax=Kordiimonas pumila TaxID=2161677 RepID=A0ABV7DA12_9PROT|nr:pyridoxamine 5'-phosphate oxidase family protein [Kordiimonas pumila]